MGAMSTRAARERGHAGGYGPRLISTTGQTGARYEVISPIEAARELQFPDSIIVYDAMRTETHLAGILEAIVQAALSAGWNLETEGVPDDVVTLCRTELGLVSPGEPMAQVEHQGVEVINHLEEMLETMLIAGFSAAEIVFDAGAPTPAQEGINAGVGGQIRHLRKLAPRPPRTITRIETERDGGLKAIYQTPLDYTALEDTPIPVEDLVMYTYKKRGANWAGESLFRTAYRPWSIKDIYLRLDAAAVDKHSNGYWIGKSADQKRADALYEELSELHSGERGALVTDPNDEVNLMGVSGSLVDITPRLKYLDQEMSRSALAMFLDLGHDNGARSLGETHLRIFYNKVDSIAKYMGRVLTQNVIRKLVAHNFPAGTPWPSLVPGDVVSQQSGSIENLTSLMNAGIITYDKGLEEYARARYGAPPLPAGHQPPTPTVAAPTVLAPPTIGVAAPTNDGEEPEGEPTALERADAAIAALRERIGTRP